MRETRFIEQNKRKWATFEQKLAAPQTDAEELSNQFIDITDDLSYARTFYTNRSVREYLNNIAQKVFYSVYKNRRGRLSRFWSFWREDVPQIIWESRKTFLFSFLIFFVSMFVGIFSSYMDTEFPRIVLGDEYVQMTYNNIASGQPMSVYSNMNSTDMFLHIAFNNLYVAFTTFILGLFFGLGTISRLVFNGVMLGAFQAIFFQEGIYLEMFLALWLHGTIEIACIIVAGAGGLTLGQGLAFPGTYTRLQSLQLAARRGLLIMLTIAPLIVLAAFIEGFMTRLTDMSDVLRGAVVLGSLFFVLFYFVWYPWRKARRDNIAFLREANLPASEESSVNFERTKSLGLLFGDTFNIFRQRLRPLLLGALLCTAGYVSAVLWQDMRFTFSTAVTWTSMFDEMFYNVGQFLFPRVNNFDTEPAFVLFLANWLASACMVFLFLHIVQSAANKGQPRPGFSYYLFAGLSALAVTFLFQVILALDAGWVVLSVFFVFPFLALWLSAVFNERRDPFTALGRAFTVIYGNYWLMNASYWVVLGLCMVFLFISTAPLLVVYFQVLVSFLPLSPVQIAIFHQGFFVGVHIFMMCLLLPLSFGIVSMGFFSFRETSEARDLLRRINQIGLRKHSYGLERE